jgi:hypothetical protein
MSDVSYNVEDGQGPPDPAPEPTPPVAEAAPAAPPAPPAAPEEPETHEVGGQRMVPLAALQAEREAARALRQKAEQFDQVSGWYAQNKPYIDFLQANPDLMKPRQAAPPPPPAATPPEQDETLVSLARTLDLYTADGQPDAKRAAVIKNLVKSEAQSIAQETVRPIQEESIQERSQRNYRDALNLVLPNGQKFDPNVVHAVWRNGNPKDLANPDTALMAIAALSQIQQFQQQQSQVPTIQAPIQAPVVTESPGSRTPQRAPISEFETRVANIRGITPQKYAEYVRDFRPGQSNVLESD